MSDDLGARPPATGQPRLKRYWPKVAAIKALEPRVAALSDEELRAKTDEFRAILAERPKPSA